MAKYSMVVQSKAIDGKDAEYNTWYDNQHFGDICAIPGITGGRRLEQVMTVAGEPGLKYLAIYDVETDDIGGVMAEMGRRGAEGLMRFPTRSMHLHRSFGSTRSATDTSKRAG